MIFWAVGSWAKGGVGSNSEKSLGGVRLRVCVCALGKHLVLQRGVVSVASAFGTPKFLNQTV